MRLLHHLHRTLTTSTRQRIPVPTTSSPPALPITQLCPLPTTTPCACDPSGLEIDRITPLMNTMPRYFQHVLVSTGRIDWASKIELDPRDMLAGRLKALQSQKGRGLRDPFAPTLITNSSFEGAGGAYILPAGRYFPSLPLDDAAALEGVVRRYLLPPTAATTTATTTTTALPESRRVTETLILICSHTSRDSRCGAYYPVLRNEFSRVLQERGLEGSVKVAATSHLSGHKFAGNVVVYLPGEEDREGWGVWYGRVGVRQVAGIVDETVVGRRVVGELCRGVVGREVEV